MEIVAYKLIGLITLIRGACAVTPIILDSMSKEEREAAGIVWKEND